MTTSHRNAISDGSGTRARRRMGVALSGLVVGVALCVVTLCGPHESRAWDPSTTHQGLLDHALRTSQWHRRWMDQSGLARGLFTPLRVDPALLRSGQDPALSQILRSVHDDSGAMPLGGPWSCPKPPAPEETLRYCVEGSVWSQSALGWIRLGMIAEVSPPERQIHHFLSLTNEGAAQQWSDGDAAASRIRQRSVRSNGLSRIATLTRSRGVDRALSANGWLHSDKDPFAPAQMQRNLELASTSAEPRTREHHLALALLQFGALLHVVQDAAVPAHARGDLRAFTAHLSPRPRDRGLALQEVARSLYGRADLPLSKPVPVAVDAAPLAYTIEAHLSSTDEDIGLARFATAHFISEGDLPAPRAVPRDVTPEQAATLLLAGVSLSPAELTGATLRGWPSDRGYLVTSEGRALAGYVVDESDRVRLFIDRLILREQAAVLLPRAAEATRSILDLVFPVFPTASWTGGGEVLMIKLPEHYAQARLLVLREDSSGRRTPIKEATLKPGQSHTIAGLAPAWNGGEPIVVLVLGFQDGLGTVQEQRGATLPGAPGQSAAPVGTPDTTPEESPEGTPEGTETPDGAANPTDAGLSTPSVGTGAGINAGTGAAADTSTSGTTDTTGTTGGSSKKLPPAASDPAATVPSAAIPASKPSKTPKAPPGPSPN